MYLTRFKYIPLIGTLGNYKKEYFSKDLIAALTVAVVVIPQSMAYALIAGVNPVYGLYTAIVSTIIASAFGSSKHAIAGPTNAIALLVAGNMSKYMGLDNAYEMLFLMTFMVGVLQILFGVIKLGKVINFVSHSVVIGFTAGAGVLIGLGQLSTLLSISIKDSSHMSTMQKFYYVMTHLSETNYYALGIGLITMAIIIVCKKINKSLPGALIGIIVTILLIVTFSLEQKGVKLTGFIPSSLPPFKMIQFDFVAMQNLFGGALAIAIIGLVEAIAISKSIATTSRQKIDANQEFIAQGLANAGGSFFQAFAGSGSFTRSAINYQSGAVTRIAGILSGVIVALVLLFFAPFAKFIPNPALAGVILVIAYNMVDKKEIKHIVKAGKFKSDSIAMWATCFATILMPHLDLAIYSGIALSIALYLKDTNKAPMKILIPSQVNTSQIIEKEIKSVKSKVDILIIQLEGNLYFGSSEDLQSKLDDLVDKSKVFILRMKYVASMDLTALSSIKIFIRTVKEAGGIVIICGVKSELNSLLTNSNVIADVGEENIFMSENEIFASSTNALEKARAALNCDDNGEKSAACTLLESVTNFNGGNSTTNKNSASL
ncbi:SulP family inorganic anion transporter [Desulfosporosinus sp. BICA1-9]|uniref:SulP family inorganic anion transporter n=1 Tax=Desulfosporosinus sp. BICA1-9 TaxID=1531958 RepID=UPI00054C586C|nr:SulP family inorganic anion transporter [Desulfosporosinus sp. BICA1-9]KJS49713.1 MAG: sulfate permease [Peptococcaceae bacterium BRH_c23]KJS88307.1 MAG: sulfate permease [Desulfosporosinus sp. BICA1-9]HBW35978.1 SulP family inorganic anion transporter [Desulfosporosinus sp.]